MKGDLKEKWFLPILLFLVILGLLGIPMQTFVVYKCENNGGTYKIISGSGKYATYGCVKEK